MSFFISSMPAAGLMSRPPESKQTPLPTSVTFGWAASPQLKSTRRGASSAARPTAWISGSLASSRCFAAGDDRACAELRGDAQRRRLQRGGAKIVGGRVDEIAAERDGFGDALHAGDITPAGAQSSACPEESAL